MILLIGAGFFQGGGPKDYEVNVSDIREKVKYNEETGKLLLRNNLSDASGRRK